MITKKCELVAGDYLFLRDKLKELQSDTTKLQNKEQIQTLADSFILTFLGPPASNIIYPNVPKTTLQRVELRVRDALKEPLDKIPLELDASIAELQDEMWQKVVECELPEREPKQPSSLCASDYPGIHTKVGGVPVVKHNPELYHENIVAMRASLKTIEFTRDVETVIRELDRIILYAEQLKRLVKGER